MKAYDDLKQSGQLTETLATLKAYLEVSKDTPAPTPEQYRKLGQKYEEALKLIEILKAEVEEAQANKLPTKDEVESMSAMLDVLNKLDIKTLDKLSMLGKKDTPTND